MFCFVLFVVVHGQLINAQQKSALTTLLNDLCGASQAGCNVPNVAAATNCTTFEGMGIECDTSGNIVTIDLNSRSLGGSIGSALNSLTFLRTLQLHENSIASQWQSAALSKLENVVLSNNRFFGPLKVLASLSSLKNLLIGGNNFADLFPTFASTRLQHVDLSNNDLLMSTIPDSFGDQQNLTTFLARNCGLIGALPTSLLSKRLESLDISGNRLSGMLGSFPSTLSEGCVFQTGSDNCFVGCAKAPAICLCAAPATNCPVVTSTKATTTTTTQTTTKATAPTTTTTTTTTSTTALITQTTATTMTTKTATPSTTATTATLPLSSTTPSSTTSTTATTPSLSSLEVTTISTTKTDSTAGTSVPNVDSLTTTTAMNSSNILTSILISTTELPPNVVASSGLPLLYVIIIAAGGGGFCLLLVIAIVVVVVCRRRRGEYGDAMSSLPSSQSSSGIGVISLRADLDQQLPPPHQQESVVPRYVVPLEVTAPGYTVVPTEVMPSEYTILQPAPPSNYSQSSSSSSRRLSAQYDKAPV